VVREAGDATAVVTAVAAAVGRSAARHHATPTTVTSTTIPARITVNVLRYHGGVESSGTASLLR
jgi:hypothetical protein